VPDDDDYVDVEVIDESHTDVGDILKARGDSVVYVYDFGEDWRHDVVLEKILPAPRTKVRPVCLAGERHCPPEDVGGPPGYEEFLEVIFDPTHEEHEHYPRWAGGPSVLTRPAERFQPEAFDVSLVNSTLSRMPWPSRHRR